MIVMTNQPTMQNIFRMFKALKGFSPYSHLLQLLAVEKLHKPEFL